MTLWIVLQETPGGDVGGVVAFTAEDAERVAQGQRGALGFRHGPSGWRVWIEKHEEREP